MYETLLMVVKIPYIKVQILSILESLSSAECKTKIQRGCPNWMRAKSSRFERRGRWCVFQHRRRRRSVQFFLSVLTRAQTQKRRAGNFAWGSTLVNGGWCKRQTSFCSKDPSTWWSTLYSSRILLAPCPRVSIEKSCWCIFFWEKISHKLQTKLI
jgi:hypothetical protein